MLSWYLDYCILHYFLYEQSFTNVVHDLEFNPNNLVLEFMKYVVISYLTAENKDTTKGYSKVTA